MIACEIGGLSSSFSTASNHSRTLSRSLASSGTAPEGFGKIGIYSNAIYASNFILTARGTSRNKRVQQLSCSDPDGAGSANMTSPAHGSVSRLSCPYSGDGNRS